MINNLKKYLNTGLIKSTFVNLKIRKLSAETCHEFIEWCGLLGSKPYCDKLVLNEVIFKQDLYMDFIICNPDFAPKAKRTISRTEFYKWLISYGVFMTGNVPADGRSASGLWIKFTGTKDDDQFNF